MNSNHNCSCADKPFCKLCIIVLWLHDIQPTFSIQTRMDFLFNKGSKSVATSCKLLDIHFQTKLIKFRLLVSNRVEISKVYHISTQSYKPRKTLACDELSNWTTTTDQRFNILVQMINYLLLNCTTWLISIN